MSSRAKRRGSYDPFFSYDAKGNKSPQPLTWFLIIISLIGFFAVMSGNLSRNWAAGVLAGVIGVGSLIFWKSSDYEAPKTSKLRYH